MTPVSYVADTQPHHEPYGMKERLRGIGLVLLLMLGAWADGRSTLRDGAVTAELPAIEAVAS